MIRLKKLHLAVLLFSLFILSVMLPVKLQAAERYTVKTSIFVPAGWEVPPDLLEQQKQDILIGLKEVQTAYQQKLSGKTFNFENQVNVVFSPNRPDPTAPPTAKLAADIFYQTGGHQLFPDQDGIINLIWVVGSADLTPSALQITYPGTESGEAFMNHQNIFTLTSLGSVKRDQTLAIVAHELGHAFGLVFDGWAKSHPCSEISPEECHQSAPKPLPRGEEYLNAIMGVHLFGLFGSHFNNSTYNPEICKIFDSPFINPTHDSCPAKTVPLLPDQTVEIRDISPVQVAPGEIVEITGRGFGERGTVIFHNPYYDTQNYYVNDQDLLEWTDESVRVYVPTIIGQAQLSSIWKIRILDNKNRMKVTSEQFLTIKPTDLSPFLINADIQISCGKDKKVISGVNPTLVKASDPKIILSEAVTDEQGKTSLTYTVEKPQPNDIYLIVPPFLEDASPPQPDPTPVRIPPIIEINSRLFMSTAIYYQRCPASLEDQLGAPLPIPSALPTPSPSLIPEPNITGDTAFYLPPSPSPSSICSSDFVTACWKGAECKEENQDSADFVCSQNHGQGSRCTRFINQPDTYDDGCTMTGLAPEPNLTSDTAFYYYASPIPSPTPESLPSSTPEPQGGLPQPTESPASQQTELTQVMISNYADFRFYNDPDDQGSSTISISNPYDPQNLEWIAKTMGPEKRMYVREIYSNGTYRDFEYPITHNDQRSSVSNIQILIKIVKKVARITIGDLDLEIDVKNPQVPLDFHLPGTEGQGQQFKIPVVITYSDGSTLHTALTFNYLPDRQAGNPPSLPTPTPAPTPCPYQEDPQNCPYGGIRDCTGTQQDGTCKYDPAVDPNCRETCNPAPGNTCAYTESFNCTGQNAGCGAGSGEMKKTIINSDCSEKFETYCDSACASSGGGGTEARCPDPYPECQEANTFWITPECDSDGNIINYDKRDLGDLGQCQ